MTNPLHRSANYSKTSTTPPHSHAEARNEGNILYTPTDLTIQENNVKPQPKTKTCYLSVLLISSFPMLQLQSFELCINSNPAIAKLHVCGYEANGDERLVSMKSATPLDPCGGWRCSATSEAVSSSSEDTSIKEITLLMKSCY
jgi:hypothetical protein